MSERRASKKAKAPEKEPATVSMIDPQLMTPQQLKDMKKAIRAQEKQDRKRLQRRQKAAEDAEREYQAEQARERSLRHEPSPGGVHATRLNQTASPHIVMDDDDQENEEDIDEDSNNGYESGSRTTGATARKRKRSERAASSNTNTGEGSRDEEGVRPSEQERPLPRGIARITVGTPQALRKANKTQKAKKNRSTRDDIVSDSSGEEAAQVDEPVGPHTPYKVLRCARGKKTPALDAFTPTSKGIGEDTRADYAAMLVLKDAFPNEKRASRVARRLFRKHTAPESGSNDGSDLGSDDEDKRSRRGERARADATYKAHMQFLTIGVDSSFCGHVVTDAEELVAMHYELRGKSMTDGARKDLVEKLLENGAFTFKEYKTRDGAFQCPVLPDLFRKSFLTRQVKKGQPLALGPHLADFALVPPPLLAFLLTAVECILRRWKTGMYDKHNFSTTKYEPIYTRHLEALKSTEESTPGYLSQIGTELWIEACRQAGIDSDAGKKSEGAGGYMRPEDLEKLNSSSSPMAG